MPFSETYWIGFYTFGGAFILALMKILYQSKCSNIDLCCLKITRQIEQEEKIDELTIERNGANTAISNKNINYINEASNNFNTSKSNADQKV